MLKGKKIVTPITSAINAETAQIVSNETIILDNILVNLHKPFFGLLLQDLKFKFSG